MEVGKEHRVQLGPVSQWPTRVVLLLVGVAIGWMLATWLEHRNSEPVAPASMATVCDGQTNIHLDLNGLGRGQLEFRLPLRGGDSAMIPVTTGGYAVYIGRPDGHQWIVPTSGRIRLAVELGYEVEGVTVPFQVWAGSEERIAGTVDVHRCD